VVVVVVVLVVVVVVVVVVVSVTVVVVSVSVSFLLGVSSLESGGMGLTLLRRIARPAARQGGNITARHRAGRDDRITVCLLATFVNPQSK
jgi:hypothetical protein